MDGSWIGAIAQQAGPLDGAAIIVACLVGWFLWHHTKDCSQSRKNLYDAIRENTKALGELAERIARLEGSLE